MKNTLLDSAIVAVLGLLGFALALLMCGCSEPVHAGNPELTATLAALKQPAVKSEIKAPEPVPDMLNPFPTPAASAPDVDALKRRVAALEQRLSTVESRCRCQVTASSRVTLPTPVAAPRTVVTTSPAIPATVYYSQPAVTRYVSPPAPMTTYRYSAPRVFRGGSSCGPGGCR